MADAAERYTHGHPESVLRAHRWRTVQNSAAFLKPYLAAGSDLLDVGCGPGTVTLDLARRLDPGRVTGLDASADVIESARVIGAEQLNLDFVVGDAYALPFDDDSFDIVFAHQLLQHLADPVAALTEMRRVARPGGIVAARDVDYAALAWFPLLPGLDKWLTVYQSVHRSNGGEPDAGRRLKGWARAAGFEAVAPTASVWSFASRRETEWWGILWAERVLESPFAKDALVKGLAAQSDLVDISRAWRVWATHPDATLVMPHGEVVCRV